MSTNATNPPPLLHILETCLYVGSAREAAKFYADTFDVKPVFVTVSFS